MSVSSFVKEVVSCIDVGKPQETQPDLIGGWLV
jgi:hypothetical protein